LTFLHQLSYRKQGPPASPKWAPSPSWTALRTRVASGHRLREPEKKIEEDPPTEGENRGV